MCSSKGSALRKNATIDAADRKLARIGDVLGAQPRGDGSWYAADCPDCGTRWSMSLTRRGAECRFDACRWTTCDLRVVVSRWLAAAGRSASEIAMVVRKVA